MQIITAIVGVIVMGLGAVTIAGMLIGGVIAVCITAREKRKDKKAKKAVEEA